MTNSVAVIAGAPVSTDHWIGGRRVASADRFDVLSPIDGAVVAAVSSGGEEDVNAAVDAARRAYPAWAALGPEGRAPILRAFAAGILARSADLAAVETVDNGSLLTANILRLVPRSAQNISFFADWALTLNDHVIDSPEVTNHVRYDPSGVAALITPWNAPLMLTTWKIGPALAAGNTIVVKPPEWAPLTCSLLADIAHGAGVPAGVFNLVQGIGAQAGAALVSHPDIDRISFTGSTQTAKSIGKAAAETLTPVGFELGGKSPLIVFGDADLDAAAQTIAGQYMNAGQVCLAGTRIYVEDSAAAEVLARVRAAVAAQIVGDPRDPATRVGPLIAQRHFDKVAGLVARARAAGAEPLWGGAPHDFGALYFQPTMLTGVGREWEIFQTEVFGPVLLWSTFCTEDEVIEIANATEYGLAASIYTRDAAKAERIAGAVVAGTVWVNCFFIRDLAAPFGGARNSGIGREGGTHSFDFFCNVKNIAVRKGSYA